MAKPTLFPRRSFVIETELAPRDAAAALRQDVGEGLPFFGGGLGRREPFLGRVWEQGFEIRRVIAYRNSFLPIVKGQIEPAGQGSRVSVTMAAHPFVRVFLGVWLALAVAGSVTLLGASLARGPDVGALVPLGMVAFGLLLPRLGFGREARLAEELIRRRLPERQAVPGAGAHR